MKILVTGAAGFIGSILVERLVERGHSVTALDNLSHGHREAVDPRATFVEADLLDAAQLTELLVRLRPDVVCHLAAEALIDRSVRDPGLFFRANAVGGLNLLDAMLASDVRRIVYSSTAAVYGQPTVVPIVEEAPLEPVNAYGESKLFVERMLAWYRRAHSFRYIALRYMNASGATERYGEFHVPETHVIPSLFDVVTGRREAFHLFGVDYDTPDGTCIRDYVHVSDIASAHELAIDRLGSDVSAVYNIGNDRGYSNLEVIRAVEAVTGRKIHVKESPRRLGDPARLIASSHRIRNELDWRPRWTELTAMVETAWRWRLSHQHGYR